MMTTKKFNLVYVAFGLVTAFTVGACSTMQSGPSDKDMASASTGPAVVYTRVEPSTVELNRDFQPSKPAEVLADVKDFNSKVKDVKLQFENVPLEIPMENIGGSTWRAQLTPRQLEMLAVNGKTTSYKAHVVARDEDGKSAVSPRGNRCRLIAGPGLLEPPMRLHCSDLIWIHGKGSAPISPENPGNPQGSPGFSFRRIYRSETRSIRPRCPYGCPGSRASHPTRCN
jgi:hypothetical protein